MHVFSASMGESHRGEDKSRCDGVGEVSEEMSCRGKSPKMLSQADGTSTKE